MFSAKDLQMLVLSRKEHEALTIGLSAELLRQLADEGCGIEIEVMAVETNSDKCRLGVTAPPSIPVHRNEVWSKIKEQGNAKPA